MLSLDDGPSALWTASTMHVVLEVGLLDRRRPGGRHSCGTGQLSATTIGNGRTFEDTAGRCEGR